jgi:hypothetical protein
MTFKQKRSSEMTNAKVLLVIALVLSSTAAWSTPLANPGFETGDFSGWTLGGSCLDATDLGAGPCWSGIAANPVYEGTYAARFGSQPESSTLSQFVDLPSGSYTLNFYLRLTTANPKGSNTFDPANYIYVNWGGHQIGSLESLDASTVWSKYSFDLESYGASSLLFEFRQDFVGDFFIDDITLDTRTPEPGTICLFGLGLACLGLARRRFGRA